MQIIHTRTNPATTRLSAPGARSATTTMSGNPNANHPHMQARHLRIARRAASSSRSRSTQPSPGLTQSVEHLDKLQSPRPRFASAGFVGFIQLFYGTAICQGKSIKPGTDNQYAANAQASIPAMRIPHL
jgi:hypothetical protein